MGAMKRIYTERNSKREPDPCSERAVLAVLYPRRAQKKIVFDKPRSPK